jgi:hypothetical protein
MTEANFSSKKLGVPGAIIISAWLSSGKDKGTLTLLDISNNRLTLGDYHGNDTDGRYTGGRDNDNNYATDMTGMCSPLEVCLLICSATAGVTALADAIPGMGAMTCLDLSKNNIGKHPEGWETGSDKAGDKFYRPQGGEWQRSSPATDAIITLANAIRDMGALTKFIFSGDDSSKTVTMETIMTVADFSEKGLGKSGAIMLSAFLPKCT